LTNFHSLPSSCSILRMRGVALICSQIPDDAGKMAQSNCPVELSCFKQKYHTVPSNADENQEAFFSVRWLRCFLNSAKDMSRVSRAIFSFTSRKNFTVSNSFSGLACFLIIAYNVFGRSDIQLAVAIFQIDGVVALDSENIDDVFEIPANQVIYLMDGCAGNVAAIV